MTKEEEEKNSGRKSYISDWDKKNRMAVTIRLRKKEDAELIKIYKEIPNKAEWFRECLLKQKKAMNKTASR